MATTTTNYVFDNSGRMTTMWSTDTADATYFTYNQRDMVTRILRLPSGGDATRTFAYNAIGERVVVDESGGTTPNYWTYDGYKLLTERTNSGSTTRRYRHNAMPQEKLGANLEMNSASFGKCAPVTDQGGALTSLQNVEGNDVFWTNAYGEPLAIVNNLNDRLRLPQELGTQALTTTVPFFLIPGGGVYLPRISRAFGGASALRADLGAVVVSMLLNTGDLLGTQDNVTFQDLEWKNEDFAKWKEKFYADRKKQLVAAKEGEKCKAVSHKILSKPDDVTSLKDPDHLKGFDYKGLKGFGQVGSAKNAILRFRFEIQVTLEKGSKWWLCRYQQWVRSRLDLVEGLGRTAGKNAGTFKVGKIPAKDASENDFPDYKQFDDERAKNKPADVTEGDFKLDAEYLKDFPVVEAQLSFWVIDDIHVAWQDVHGFKTAFYGDRIRSEFQEKVIPYPVAAPYEFSFTIDQSKIKPKEKGGPERAGGLTEGPAGADFFK